jgi:DNA-binding NarL/FixJ family response regulator
LESSTFRVLVVDDYERWRAFVTSTLNSQPKLRIIGEAKDGLEAVQMAQQLQPDLILLDIGMPTLNGIEAARRIREVSPKSKILFVSENRSRDIAEEALRTGASGYVVKAAASSELLPAVEAVLQGKRFVSASLTGAALGDLENERTPDDSGGDKVNARTPRQAGETAPNHEVGFYSDESSLLENVTQFIGAALDLGHAAIVVATKSHRDSLLSRLEVRGLDIGAAIKQGRLVALDATDVLSAFLLNGMPDPALFMEAFGNLIAKVVKAAKVEHPRVVIFGECVHLLWAEGNPEAAIAAEKLGNQLITVYGVDILCGYAVGQSGLDDHIFQRICAEHSAVYSW